jgi:hypothetical protein
MALKTSSFTPKVLMPRRAVAQRQARSSLRVEAKKVRAEYWTAG